MPEQMDPTKADRILLKSQLYRCMCLVDLVLGGKVTVGTGTCRETIMGDVDKARKRVVEWQAKLANLQAANARREKATDLTKFLRLTAELAEGDGCPEEAAQLRLAADRIAELEQEAEELRAIVDAGVEWRSASVHHGACTLGFREGDGIAAAEECRKKLVKLSIAIDRYHYEAVEATAAEDAGA